MRYKPTINLMDAAGSYSTGAAVQSPQSVTETLLDLLRDDVPSDVPLEIPALEDGHMISEVFPNNLLK